MSKLAVIKTGGKQYLVSENDEIIVDRIPDQKTKSIEVETLAIFGEDGKKLEFSPTLKTKVKVTVLENILGDKVRVAKFKSKVRYRKVKGFRASLTKIKIGTL